MRFCNRIVFPSALHTGDREPVRPGADAGYRSPAVRREQSDTRRRWPFLDDPRTPVELQALVTQRITRYHEYSQLYTKLRDCKTVAELSTVCGKLLDAYLDNQAIARELDYYQKHGRVLGRHPMFRHFQQLTRLRSSSIKDLLREQQKTKDNIWRVKSELKKADKPHLDARRRQKLQEYELKLQEINRLLGE